MAKKPTTKSAAPVAPHSTPLLSLHQKPSERTLPHATRQQEGQGHKAQPQKMQRIAATSASTRRHAANAPALRCVPAESRRTDSASHEAAMSSPSKSDADLNTESTVRHKKTTTLPEVKPETNITALRDSVREAVIAGEDTWSIATRLIDENGMSRPAAQRLIRNTIKELEKAFVRAPSLDEHLAVSVAQRNRIVREALAAEDYRIALSALDGRDKLLGLFGRDLTETERADSLVELIRRAAE